MFYLLHPLKKENLYCLCYIFTFLSPSCCIEFTFLALVSYYIEFILSKIVYLPCFNLVLHWVHVRYCSMFCYCYSVTWDHPFKAGLSSFLAPLCCTEFTFLALALCLSWVHPFKDGLPLLFTFSVAFFASVFVLHWVKPLQDGLLSLL